MQIIQCADMLPMFDACFITKAIVSSHFLCHTTQVNINRLQRVQNTLGCIICRLNRFSHITPFLNKHYIGSPLSIAKYNLLKYKAITLNQPSYLSSLMKGTSHVANAFQFPEPNPTNSCGRTFCAVPAPSDWNKLPKVFRTQYIVTGFR